LIEIYTDPQNLSTEEFRKKVIKCTCSVPTHLRFQEASTLNFTPCRLILRREGEEYEGKNLFDPIFGICLNAPGRSLRLGPAKIWGSCPGHYTFLCGGQRAIRIHLEDLNVFLFTLLFLLEFDMIIRE
jgi:hypothetical protein